jgi:hypothetical protein
MNRPLDLLFMALTVLSLSACTSKGERDLAQTLAWMSETYNNGHGEIENTARYGGSIRRMTQTLEYSGCQVTSKTHEVHVAGPPGANPEVAYTFDLANVDPQSLRLCSYDGVLIFHESCAPPEQFRPDPEESLRTLLYFSTTNEARAIRVTSMGITLSRESFILDDLDYARRFAKAFRRAAELCGGKPSKF